MKYWKLGNIIKITQGIIDFRSSYGTKELYVSSVMKVLKHIIAPTKTTLLDCLSKEYFMDLSALNFLSPSFPARRYTLLSHFIAVLREFQSFSFVPFPYDIRATNLLSYLFFYVNMTSLI